MNNIKLLRKNKGMSQLELAEALNVHQTAISQWETNKTNPDTELAIRIADYFNVTIDYLLGRTDNQNPPDQLVIPDELKGVKIAFHHGDFEDLTQYEVDRLAEVARFLKTQRKESNPNDKT